MTLSTETLRELPPAGRSWADAVHELTPELVPVHNDDFPGGNVTVIGSFKGWYDQIVPTRERLRSAGFYPLAPLGKRIVDYAGADGKFEVVDADRQKIALLQERLGRMLSRTEMAIYLEKLFCMAIETSDFVYVAGLPKTEIDDGDYIGLQVAGELGIALGSGPVYGTRISPTLDEREGMLSNFAGYASMIVTATPEELGSLYREGRLP